MANIDSTMLCQFLQYPFDSRMTDVIAVNQQCDSFFLLHIQLLYSLLQWGTSYNLNKPGHYECVKCQLRGNALGEACDSPLWNRLWLLLFPLISDSNIGEIYKDANEVQKLIIALKFFGR